MTLASRIIAFNMRSRHQHVVKEPWSAPVFLVCQKLSHYIHFTCIKFLHPASQELQHHSAAFTMMPRGCADVVKCAVKMLGRIPTTLSINRIFSPQKSPLWGVGVGEFHYNDKQRSGLKSAAKILLLTFTFIYPSFHRRVSEWYLENWFINAHMYECDIDNFHCLWIKAKPK